MRSERPARIVEARLPTSIAEPAVGSVSIEREPPDFGYDVVESELPDGTPVEVEVSGTVPDHRHRRGKVVGTRYVQGTAVRTFACTQPGCPWTST